MVGRVGRRADEQHNLSYQTDWARANQKDRTDRTDPTDPSDLAGDRLLLVVLPEVGEDLLQGLNQVVLVDLALAERQG